MTRDDEINAMLDELDALHVASVAKSKQVRAAVNEPPPITDAAGLTAGLLRGGPLRIAPGTYAGNFIAAKPCSLTGIDTLTARVAPEDVAPWTLTALDVLKPTLTITADDVIIRGLTLTGVAADRTVLTVGSSTATTVEAQPHRITLDQVAILAGATGGHRGLEAHAVDLTLARSYVAGFLEVGRDSQAIWINNGPGPYLIDDCFLEASGENILVGGADPKIPNCVPSDITVRGCLLFKPQVWRQKPGSVKNSFELKNAQRVIFEQNILDGCWKDGQPGNLIVLTPRNQSGTAPWAVVQDVIIRGNRSVRHTNGYAVNILGHDNERPSQQTARISIEGNLFQDSVKGVLVIAGVTDYLRVVRNTLPGIRWNLLTFDSTGPLTPLTWNANVALSGDYGCNSSTASVGVPTLAAYTTGLLWMDAVIEKTAARTIPWPSPTSNPAGTTQLLPVGGLAPLLDADYHYTPDPSKGW